MSRRRPTRHVSPASIATAVLVVFPSYVAVQAVRLGVEHATHRISRIVRGRKTAA
jgi:hypothetical protein